MILLYLETESFPFLIEKEKALPALESQVLDIFETLNSIETSILGLLTEDFIEIKISSCNRFLWRIDIIDLKNHQQNLHFYSTQRVKNLIHDIFDGIKPI